MTKPKTSPTWPTDLEPERWSDRILKIVAGGTEVLPFCSFSLGKIACEIPKHYEPGMPLRTGQSLKLEIRLPATDKTSERAALLNLLTYLRGQVRLLEQGRPSKFTDAFGRYKVYEFIGETTDLSRDIKNDCEFHWRRNNLPPRPSAKR